MASALQHEAHSYCIFATPHQMLEFCRDTHLDLSNFEADGVSRIYYTKIAVADVLSHLTRRGQPS